MKKLRFKDYREYESYFSRLIELERRAQMSQHLEEIKKLPGEERERRGRAILNLRGKLTGRGLGGVYLVRYTRREGLPRTEISVGDVVLVSRGRPTGREVQGTVAEITPHYVVVAFRDYPPPYALGKGVRLDLFSNETTFRRMEEALKKLKEHPLRDIILGRGW